MPPLQIFQPKPPARYSQAAGEVKVSVAENVAVDLSNNKNTASNIITLTNTVTPAKSSEKAITAFGFPALSVTVTVTQPTQITAANVSITAPVLGAAPQNAADVETVTANADYTVTGLTWNEALTAGGKFKAGQAYTATVPLTSKNGKKFQTAAFTPTVAGSASVGNTTNTG